MTRLEICRRGGRTMETGLGREDGDPVNVFLSNGTCACFHEFFVKDSDTTKNAGYHPESGTRR